MKGEKVRGGKGIQIFGIHATEEWRSGGAREGKREKGSGDDEGHMGNRKEVMGKGLGKKNVVV